jgi:hypothetical protein
MDGEDLQQQVAEMPGDVPALKAPESRSRPASFASLKGLSRIVESAMLHRSITRAAHQ